MTGTMCGMDQQQLEWVAAAVLSARLEAGLSKEAAARKAEVSTITYKRVEDGLTVRDSSLAKIGQALNVDVPGFSNIHTSGAGSSTTRPDSVGGDDEDDVFELKMRRPDGMSVEEWKRRTNEYREEFEWKIRRAAGER